MARVLAYNPAHALTHDNATVFTATGEGGTDFHKRITQRE